MGQRFSMCAQPPPEAGLPTKNTAVVKESDALLAPAPAPEEPPKRKPGVDGIYLFKDKLHIPAFIVISAVVLVYGTLSVGFNIYNSFLLRIVPGFKFPVVYTTTHMFAGFVGSATLIFGFKMGTVSWARFTQKWRPLIVLAVLRSGTILLNNASLVLIDLTLNKVIKSTVPVFVVAFSVIIEKKSFRWPVFVILFFIVFGTILACIHSADNGNNPVGIVMAIGSSAVGGGGIVMSAVLLGKEHGLSPVELLFYFSPLQTVLLGSLSLFIDFGDFLEWARDSHSAEASGFIAIGAGLAFLFNLTGFCLVQTTSAVTTAICGNMVVVVVIVLGSIYLHVEASPINIVGYCITTVMAMIYVAYNIQQKKVCAPERKGAEQPKPAATVASSQ